MVGTKCSAEWNQWRKGQGPKTRKGTDLVTLNFGVASPSDYELTSSTHGVRNQVGEIWSQSPCLVRTARSLARPTPPSTASGLTLQQRIAVLGTVLLTAVGLLVALQTGSARAATHSVLDLRDTFERNVHAGFGSAQRGGPWAVGANSRHAHFSVANGRGTIGPLPGGRSATASLHVGAGRQPAPAGRVQAPAPGPARRRRPDVDEPAPRRRRRRVPRHRAGPAERHDVDLADPLPQPRGAPGRARCARSARR